MNNMVKMQCMPGNNLNCRGQEVAENPAGNNASRKYDVLCFQESFGVRQWLDHELVIDQPDAPIEASPLDEARVQLQIVEDCIKRFEFAHAENIARAAIEKARGYADYYLLSELCSSLANALKLQGKSKEQDFYTTEAGNFWEMALTVDEDLTRREEAKKKNSVD